jgi:hypothetical protein
LAVSAEKDREGKGQKTKGKNGGKLQVCKFAGDNHPRNPQFAIRNPQFATRNSQFAVRDTLCALQIE